MHNCILSNDSVSGLFPWIIPRALIFILDLLRPSRSLQGSSDQVVRRVIGAASTEFKQKGNEGKEGKYLGRLRPNGYRLTRQRLWLPYTSRSSVCGSVWENNQEKEIAAHARWIHIEALHFPDRMQLRVVAYTLCISVVPWKCAKASSESMTSNVAEFYFDSAAFTKCPSAGKCVLNCQCNGCLPLPEHGRAAGRGRHTCP